ncbi:MAG: transporter [Gammaproteobacteria bacterium]
MTVSHRLARGLACFAGCALLALAALPAAAGAQDGADDAEELAKKLSNPVASLISLPLQSNFDFDIGPSDGWRYQLNVQPVIPVSLNEDWNVISRTILPVIYQDDVFPGAGDQFGLGDVTQSLFFTPKKPLFGSLILGVGPAFLIPTATDELLGTEKFGIGPTLVALTQAGPWTIGILTNHIESVAGDDDRADVSATFIQPFLAYNTKDAWTFTIQTESSYDWEAGHWSVPINGIVSKLVSLGGQRVSLGGGVRYWAESPDSGPEGFAARLVVTFLFPT